MQDEILIKGIDGKWYILKDEELVPFGEPAQISATQKLQSGKELPKGVKEEVHTRMEKTEDRRQKTEIIVPIRPPSSVISLPVSHAEHPLRVELDELIDRVVKEVMETWKHGNPTPEQVRYGAGMETTWDAVLEKRFRTMVSARLRDVRDAAETRAMLARDQKIGGMGLIGESGIRNQESGVIEIIEKAFAEFQAKWRAVEEKKIEEWKRKQREQLQQREQQEQQEQREQPLVKSEIRSTKSEVQIAKKEDLSFRPSQKASGEISPPAPRPVVRSLDSAPAPLGMTKVENKPYTLTPRTSKVTDIRPAPKLLGPVEELASLTLEDFRRLGKVDEAAQKIQARLEVLGAQGLARRLEGIKAWQNSPLHRLYMDLTAAAFAQRKSVDAVIADRQSRSEPTLTSPEFHGIMELNTKLRF